MAAAGDNSYKVTIMTGIADIKVARSVSYTHLDVYKRQGVRLVTSPRLSKIGQWRGRRGTTMHGDKKVIQQLNLALSAELTAIVQYMAQSEMCQNWGYARLGERTKARAMEEMKHAEGLIERIIFLDSTPVVDVGLKPQLGSTVQEQMEINLKDEQDAVRE